MKSFLLYMLMAFVCLGMYGLSGFGDSGTLTLDNVPPYIILISPNGGEEWYFGQTENILWQASDTNVAQNSVCIIYDPHNGPIVTIADMSANDGIEAWIVPSSGTSDARIVISVQDLFGNLSTVESAAPFSVIAAPPAPPQNVNVQIVNTWDALISWQAVTHTVTGVPITPDGYIVLYNETPHQEPQYYYFLAETSLLSHLHPNIARFRDQFYYRVVAYIDPDGGVRGALDRLSEKGAGFGMDEIKRQIMGGGK